MRNDQIFVLLLVILLPMSGCFDGAVGDAEAEEDSERTNVVNNYYNNTTIMTAPSTEVLYVPANTTANITTSAGQLIEVLDVWLSNSDKSAGSVNDYSSILSADFMCSTHTEMQRASGIGIYSTYSDFSSDWLPSDGTSCTYYFDRTGTVNSGIGGSQHIGDAYIIYRIH